MDHVEAMRALMEADRWIDRVRGQRDHLPEADELRELEDQLRILVNSLSTTQASLAPLQASLDATHEQARQLLERVVHLESALSTSTAGARELEAVQHEVEQVRTRIAATEEVELGLLIEVEPLQDQLATIRSEAQPLAARRAEVLASLSELTQSLNEEIASLTQSRQERADELSEPWRSRYEATLKRVGGSGAALLDAGRCDGCRIALSPLELDRFKLRSPGELMECPECGRFLLS
jgi:hypothetical protein